MANLYRDAGRDHGPAQGAGAAGDAPRGREARRGSAEALGHRAPAQRRGGLRAVRRRAPGRGAAAPRSRGSEADLVATARRFSGVPYLWGGMSVQGVDCSGLTSRVYAANGIDLPRDADMQFDDPRAQPVERADLRPGDLVFFGQKKITHVGMYVGRRPLHQRHHPHAARRARGVAGRPLLDRSLSRGAPAPVRGARIPHPAPAVIQDPAPRLRLPRRRGRAGLPARARARAASAVRPPARARLDLLPAHAVHHGRASCPPRARSTARIARYLLPASLALLLLSSELKAIARLGRTALVVMTAGMAGIMLGGDRRLPRAASLAAARTPGRRSARWSATWIGGSANLVAVANALALSPELHGRPHHRGHRRRLHLDGLPHLVRGAPGGVRPLEQADRAAVEGVGANGWPSLRDKQSAAAHGRGHDADGRPGRGAHRRLPEGRARCCRRSARCSTRSRGRSSSSPPRPCSFR